MINLNNMGNIKQKFLVGDKVKFPDHFTAVGTVTTINYFDGIFYTIESDPTEVCEFKYITISSSHLEENKTKYELVSRAVFEPLIKGYCYNRCRLLKSPMCNDCLIKSFEGTRYSNFIIGEAILYDPEVSNFESGIPGYIAEIFISPDDPFSVLYQVDLVEQKSKRITATKVHLKKREHPNNFGITLEVAGELCLRCIYSDCKICKIKDYVK